MDLFISEPELTFERPKVAAVQLDEDSSMWPRQILQELFRQVPEASEYVPRVVMAQVDEEQGYGYGAVVISSTTDSAMSTTEGGVQAKQALIPVIVKQNMLQPLDLLMTKNKMRPLTGDRLREALFRPSTFELMTKDWGDQSLYNLFYPPGRSENDFGSGVSTTASGSGASAIYGSGMKYSSDEEAEKTALKDSTLMRAALESKVSPERLKRFSQKLLGRENRMAFKGQAWRSGIYRRAANAASDRANKMLKGASKGIQTFNVHDQDQVANALADASTRWVRQGMSPEDAAKKMMRLQMDIDSYRIANLRSKGIDPGPTTTRKPGEYPARFGKQASLLDVIAPTLNQPDIDKLSSAIQEDPALHRQLVGNESFRKCIAKLSEFDGEATSDASSLFEKAESLLPTHVAQFGYDQASDQYWVKTACRRYIHDKPVEFMGRKEFMKVAGPEVTQKVDTEGTVTVAEPNQDDSAFDVEASPWKVVDEPGIYKVMSSTGKELMGWVLPGLMDMDGTRLPLSVFTNGAVAMVQDSIAGSPIADGANLPSDVPKGTGIFYMAGPNSVEATVPVTVVGQEAGMDGAEVYHVKTLMGGEHRLKLVKGLKKMMADQGDGMVMLPGEVKFLKLDQETQVPLVSEPSELTKTSAYMTSSKIHVFSDGLNYGFRYENMPKLASVYPDYLGYDDAAFVLCVAGMAPQRAHELLKVAKLETTAALGLHDVHLAREFLEEPIKAGVKIAEVTQSLRRDMIKEASVLPDIQTVDSVLSLGFINPENVRTYVGHLPYLDRALSMVCELTLASRLGLTEVPEFAAARACRALNEVTEGLKALALREVDETAAA